MAAMAQCRQSSRLFFSTLLPILLGVLVGARAQTLPKNSASASNCLFPNTSMISTTACSPNDSTSMLSMMLPCQPYLDEEDEAPSHMCCGGVRNVSTFKIPCLCKYIFYPAPIVNHTRGKLMPALCNMTADLCHDCAAFLVPKDPDPHRYSSPEHSEEKVTSYKRRVIGLAIVLGFSVACIIVGVALFVRKKLKQRQAPSPVLKTEFQAKQPGSDY